MIVLCPSPTWLGLAAPLFPQAVLPNSVFEIEIKVPYNTSKQQLSATGKKADLNVGGILILPKGFKLAAKNQISKEKEDGSIVEQ